jgi:stearoyl-CoA desaturase (delta-9 desaturase)
MPVPGAGGFNLGYDSLSRPEADECGRGHVLRCRLPSLLDAANRRNRSIRSAFIVTVAPVRVSQPQTPAPAAARLWTGLTSLPFVGLHLACIGVFFVEPSPLALGLCAATYLVRMFGITAGYHRYFSHRAFKTSRVFQFILACLGCCALQKGPLWWAANHREHHLYSDRPNDPHSPRTRSFWWSHIGWILAENHNATSWQHIRDWGGYPELRFLNRFHWLPGIVLALACWLIDGGSGLVWGFFVSTILLYHATFLVNSVCHCLGGRRYRTKDDSRNNLFVALVTLGEGWHNNHHHYQSSANQGFFWWEIDVSYYVLRFLGIVGLIWHIRKPAPKRIAVSEPAA